jgi:hypothetical protein
MKIICKQNCKNMFAGTHIKFLPQVLQLADYMLQGVSRPDQFQVLVSLNLRITKLQTHATGDTRQVFIPSVYKLLTPPQMYHKKSCVICPLQGPSRRFPVKSAVLLPAILALHTQVRENGYSTRKGTVLLLV